MKKLLLIGFLLLPMTALATSWKIDDPYTFTLSTNGSSGAVDADSVPSYRVYEDETGTAILTGSMAKLDDAETTGFYSEQITLSSANGLEKGKSYNIIICAAIASVTYCTTEESFQIEAEVDANIVSDKTGYGLSDDAITSAKIAASAIGLSETAIASVTVANITPGADTKWHIQLSSNSITANGQYTRYVMVCNNQVADIINSTDGSPDYIDVDPNLPFITDPDNITCTIHEKR